MSGPDLLESNTNQSSSFRKWLVLGLFLSLLFHSGLVLFFNSTKLERFSVATERLVPRVFKMSRAVVDSTLLQDSSVEQPKAEAKPVRTEIQIPKESPSFEALMSEARATPKTPDLAKPILNEKPKAGTADLKSLSKFKESARETMDKELAEFRQQALQETYRAGSVNLSALATEAAIHAPSGAADANANFSTLDSLLAQSGDLKEGTKPILLPTDLLFDFDKSELRSQALSSLEKLGTLIKRNPKVTFSIEGHSDAFGTPERNLALSLERANVVRAWLISSMSVEPAHVETKGFGSLKLLVQPDPSVAGKTDPRFAAEVAHQQLNRRVEIVMRWEQ